VQSTAGNSALFQPFVSLHVESNTTLSFIRRWYDQDQGRIFPYLTAVVNVREGIVQGIAWDDACLFCSPSSTRCMENTYNFNGTEATNISEPTKGCWVTKEECDKAHAAGEQVCDIKVYAVWSGTDSNGVAFTSFGYRFSAFPTDQVTNAFRDLAADYLNSVGKTLENVTNTVT